VPSVSSEAGTGVREAPPRAPARASLDVLGPAATFLSGQALALAAVAAVAAPSGWAVWSLLQSWDAQHLVAIARSGYPSAAGPPAFFAFFPGFPLLVRLAAATGLPADVCGVAVSVVAGVALAYGVDRLAADLSGSSRVARFTAVALVATLPLSVVFLMPYTEASFCALAIWTLVALRRRRWLTTGLLCGAAGLVRPTVVALVLAVVVAAAAAWRAGDAERVRAAAAVALAPLGILGYLGWLAAVTGSPSTWSAGERRGWDTTFDGGAYTWSWLRTIAVGGPATMDLFILGAAATCAVTAAVLLRGGLRGHAAYVAGVLVVTLGTSGVWNSKYRLQLPALVVACAVAAPALARLPAPYRWIVLAAAAGLGCWFSAFALTSYPYAI
jgi:hypothetical protein